MLMRAELARPGLQAISNEQYNQLVTMHGSIMMFLFAPAAAYGMANFIMPLQIGAPDMSFPRLNAFSYWLYLFGGLTVVAGFLTPEGAADFGWYAYAPLNDQSSTRRAWAPTCGSSACSTAGLGTILGARQLHHHDHHAAGPRHDDVPDADLHLEHARHVDPGDHGLPGADRRRSWR